MVLSQPDLRRAVRTGRIKFDPPLEENQWSQASIDLRLGFSFTRLKSLLGMKVSIAEGLGALAASGFWDTMVLKEFNEFGKREVFDLGPGEFVLAFTHEKVVVPGSLIGLIEGRTTYARVGLSMHHTAPWIQPGFAGPSATLRVAIREPPHGAPGSLDHVLVPFVVDFFEKLAEVLPGFEGIHFFDHIHTPESNWYNYRDYVSCINPWEAVRHSAARFCPL